MTWCREWFIVSLLILAAGLFAGAALTSSPRFERVLDEHHDGKYNHVVVFEVWHDRVTGQETACAITHDSNDTGGLDGRAYPMSCFPTGRNWK